jgi:hypothetical protein
MGMFIKGNGKKEKKAEMVCILIKTPILYTKANGSKEKGMVMEQ